MTRNWAVLISMTCLLSTSTLVSLSLFPCSPALAQATAPRKAEADRLLQQGIEQYKTSQFEAALQSWQQALILYRQLQDCLGEGQSLGNLGLAYYSLGNYPRAIDYLEQQLAIAREIKDQLREGKALGNLVEARFQAGKLAQAEQDLYQAIAVYETLREKLQDADKVSIADTQRNPTVLYNRS